MDANVNFDPREDAYSKPLDQIDVSVPELYQNDIYQPYFERLRREDPVHFTADSHFGPYWSATRYKEVEPWAWARLSQRLRAIKARRAKLRPAAA